MTPRDWLGELISLMGFGSVSIEELKEEKLDNRWLVIGAESFDRGQILELVGEGGIGLDAFQYLVNLIFADEDGNVAYLVELDGFRNRQLEALSAIATNALEHVRQNQDSYAVSHLSPAERRYIHLLLKEHSDVETFSQGEEPNRQLIVRFIPS